MAAGNRARGALLTRLLQALILAFYPPGFRRAHGAEMREAFEGMLARRRERFGRASALALGLRATLDGVRKGLDERSRLRAGRRGLAAGAGNQRDRERDGGGAMINGLGSDVRYAVRSLMGSPGFTAAAVVILGIGIGANSAIYSALKSSLLARPPYPDAERLVVPSITAKESPQAEAELFPWSFPKFRVLEQYQDRLIDPVGLYAERSLTLTGDGEPIVSVTEVISPGYLDVLGIPALQGRHFTVGEGAVGSADDVAILSYGLWVERYGGDEEVVGAIVRLNDRPVTVVGVMPKGFRGLTGNADLWVPVPVAGRLLGPGMVSGAQAHWAWAIGRLRPGVSLEAARAQMQTIGDVAAEAYPTNFGSFTFGSTASAFADVRINSAARRSLLLGASAAALVLLIACANLAALQLARADGRRRETAVRIAIGATRWRIVRSVVAESVVLSMAGGAVALLVAHWAIVAIKAAWPRSFETSAVGHLRFMNAEALGLDPGVLAFTLLAAIATGVLFGALPALRLSRSGCGTALGQGVVRRARGRVDTRAALVGAQLAVAIVLLVGAGLLIQSLQHLQAVDRGFRSGNLLVFDYALPRGSAAAADPSPFHERIVTSLTRLPGVLGVGTGTPPGGGFNSITLVQAIDGRPDAAPSDQPEIGVNVVSTNHFEVLGVRVLAGRTFDDNDREDAPPVLVINKTAAEALFPDEDPLGQRMRIGMAITPEGVSAEIVGVVDDVLYQRPEAGMMATAYVSSHQMPRTRQSVIVRTTGDPLATVRQVREAINAVDPNLPITNVTTVAALDANRTSDTRAIMGLLSIFALIALVLAASGTYGIVAYGVIRRRRELGVRIAIGAQAGEVVRLVVSQGAAVVAAGSIVGLAMAWGLSRILDSMLFEVSPGDPRAYAAAAMVLGTVGVVASWLPARRATKVDPVAVLNAE